MTEFMMAVIRVARFLCIAGAILLVAIAAGLLLAPELIWQIIRYALAAICVVGAVVLLISAVKSRFRRK